MTESKKISISAKSFIASMVIIISLMILAYVLTFILPKGEFERVLDSNGNLVIDTTINAKGIFVEKEGSFPLYKFLLSPILVLGSTGNATLIMILVFLLVIGGIFQALTDQKLIEYFLKIVVDKFYNKRKVLLLILPLIFMFLSSTAGCFEEIIPLVPILCALAISLGWDGFTGICFSLIPCACGYAAGVFNPFGTGVAQKVAGITVFSGVWMRVVVFIVLYIALEVFLILYTNKLEKNNPKQDAVNKEEFIVDNSKKKGLISFGITLLIGIIAILSSIFITALQDYTLVIFALCFLIGGNLACFISKMKIKDFFHSFLNGLISMLPAIVMILFASSIKYILTESLTIDSLIRFFINAADGVPKFALILFIYLIVLIMEFFVPSGSAKAFLLIPLLVPIGTIYSLPINLIVLAYIFGDGLANVMYPTNAGLLIALNLADINYPTYVKKSWKLFVPLFVITCILLLFALAVGYH